MGSSGLHTRQLHLVGRIRYAADASALWHIRSDMMTELGETEAWTVKDSLQGMFRGLLPPGLTVRQARRRYG